jgi:hypothetical protein
VILPLACAPVGDSIVTPFQQYNQSRDQAHEAQIVGQCQ